MKCVQRNHHGQHDDNEDADYIFAGLSLCRAHFNAAASFVNPKATYQELQRGYSMAIWAMLNVDEGRREGM